MWIISQDRKIVSKAIQFFKTDSKDGTSTINVVYGTGNDEDFWLQVGKYKTDRANKIFEHMINNLCNVEKYELPKE